MVQRRMIRVLVPYSRTLYFSDKGRERGISADFVRDFERYINQKYAKQRRTFVIDRSSFEAPASVRREKR